MNPATGTGSMSVPIATSPGRSGFGPQLSLSYDSGSGNGPFGYGWSLGVPSVTRKTDKGLPEYRNSEESDVFLLSGAEDLVPVLEENEGSWQRVESERTLDGDLYHVHPYRPRTEGLFARIERWTRKSDGRVHWRSITRENVTTLYGQTADSRVADPAAPGRVFQWLVCRSYDDRGNAMVYEYAAEDSAGIDTSQAHESNRTPDSRSAQRYLKRIKYGNRTSRLDDPGLADPGWMFEVVFDYGAHDRDDPTPAGDGEWLVRRDPLSDYRAGFELRTYRLCQRVLMFHHFPGEAGVGADCLVRSTDFTYRDDIDDGRDDPHQGHPVATFLASVTQSGYRRREEGGYLKRSMPPVEFTYSRFEVDEQVQTLDEGSLENLPVGLDGGEYRWVDLDGEGVSGILTEQADNLYWKPNLGEGRFGPLEVVDAEPSTAALSSGRQQLLDLAGDGQLDLVELAVPTPGFYERIRGRRWAPFRPFRDLPSVDWDDPNLRFVDLDGNGHADVLVTEEEVFTWYPSKAEAGFGPARRVPKAVDEEEGPRLVFADGSQSIYLADFSGDGLVDLARIRNGEVCYWPNLGHGRFGAKVTMDGAPWFDAEEQFDQGRIRLTDIDGSGTTDIVYLGRAAVHVHFNESGNGWSAPRKLRGLPPVDDLTSVAAVDLLGTGTACLVWSSSRPEAPGRQLRYVDLMARGKPHLLVKVENNLGAETHIRYAPSTRFYLADKVAGKPWATRLPFPVHVVERVETHDRVSRNRFVTRYAYHHGHFDGEEREFRGFGLVEQWDTEEFAALSGNPDFPDAANLDEGSHVPPVLTRSWYHTGAFLEGGRISRHYEDEYYREGDASLGEAGLSDDQLRAMLLPDTRLPGDVLLPDGRRLPMELSGDEARQAARALRGSLLRREIFGRDGTERADRPYSTSERGYAVEMLQPAGPNRHAVFLARPRETVDFQYERELYDVDGERRADPRVSHQLTLAVDGWGNVLQSATVGYGRRFPDPELEPFDREIQARTLVTWTRNSFTNSVLDLDGPDPRGDAHRAPAKCETRTWELLNVTPAASEPLVTNLFRPEELRERGESLRDAAHDLPYQDWKGEGAADGTPHRRLLGHERTLFRSDDLDGGLSLGQLQSRALPYESYRLAFTPDLLTDVYRRKTQEGEENLLPDRAAILGEEGGYAVSDDLEAVGLFPGDDPDGHWWAPSGRLRYSPSGDDTPAEESAFARSHFFLPRQFVDPFGNVTHLSYDDHDLLLQEIQDPVGNLTTAGERDGDAGALAAQGNDYRVLKPTLVMDPNRNRSAVAFDALGLVVGTALMAKPEENLGDSLDGFESDPTEAAVLDHFSDPLNDPHAILAHATTRLVYDLFAYQRTKHQADPQSAVVHTMSRETHDAGLEASQQTRIQHSFIYSDGLGREAQKKVQAEPGPVPQRGADGQIVTGPDGLPEMTEIDVSPRWVGSGWTVFNNKGDPVRKYEPFFTDTHHFEFDVRIGVSPLLFYDPVGRIVGTLHPNHTWEKVGFDPWRQETWDVNDTVLVADPQDDPGIGNFFRRLSEEDYLPTWHDSRVGGALGAQKQDAARKAALHANTPTLVHFDSLGRSFLTIVHNIFEHSGDPALETFTEEFYRTRLSLDIEGNRREDVDALDRTVMRCDIDMLGNCVRQASMDAGRRWTLADVTGNPVRDWDGRGHAFRMAYDVLRRPTGSFLRADDAHPELMVAHTVWGEDQPNPAASNLRGQVIESRDQAGLVSNEAFDFKGNLLLTRRQLAKEYKGTRDWSASVALELESYVSRTHYDALDRPIQVIAPHSDRPGTGVNVIQPTYNETSLVEQVHVWLNRDDEPSHLLETNTADLDAITDVHYDAKGQRTRIDYGNGVKTTYSYDPLTYRLIHLVTQRDAVMFPNDCPDPPAASWPGCQVQNLRYTYDPAGNITYIRDNAQQTIYFKNKRIEPSAGYRYDALYRLVEATGREHLGQKGGVPNAPSTHTYNDSSRIRHPSAGAADRFAPNDGNVMGRYRERYVYDEVGNFLEMRHRGSDPAHPGWTRTYAYNETSELESGTQNNRLSITTVGGTTETYSSAGDGYDAHGNMLRMPQLQAMQWDFKDQLQMTQRQQVNNEDADAMRHHGERTWYVYAADGRRVRKVTELPTDQTKEERIYLGGLEIYRRHSGVHAGLVRETQHITDDKQCIAFVETRNNVNDGTPRQHTRYQIGNHLGSATLELDSEAQIISYEEYTPYGSTSYQAVRSQTETPKRYRYTGKERDEENGTYYHGARSYAPWLGRWLSVDPHCVRTYGRNSAESPYVGMANNPLSYWDPDGCNVIGDLWNNAVEGSKIVTEAISEGTTAAGEFVVDKADDAANSLRESGHPWLATGVQYAGVAGGTVVKTVGEVGGQTLAAGPNAVLALESGGGSIGRGAARIYEADEASEVVLGSLEILAGAGSGAQAGLTFVPGGRPTGPKLPGKGRVPGRVRTRINQAKGRTRFTPKRESGHPVSAGMEHVRARHTGGRTTQSQFTKDPSQVLSKPKVVKSEPRPLSIGDDVSYVRQTELGTTVGRTRTAEGGRLTNAVRVQTDAAGNVITAYPVPGWRAEFNVQMSAIGTEVTQRSVEAQRGSVGSEIPEPTEAEIEAQQSLMVEYR